MAEVDHRAGPGRRAWPHAAPSGGTASVRLPADPGRGLVAPSEPGNAPAPCATSARSPTRGDPWVRSSSAHDGRSGARVGGAGRGRGDGPRGRLSRGGAVIVHMVATPLSRMRKHAGTSIQPIFGTDRPSIGHRRPRGVSNCRFPDRHSSLRAWPYAPRARSAPSPRVRTALGARSWKAIEHSTVSGRRPRATASDASGPRAVVPRSGRRPRPPTTPGRSGRRRTPCSRSRPWCAPPSDGPRRRS